MGGNVYGMAWLEIYKIKKNLRLRLDSEILRDVKSIPSEAWHNEALDKIVYVADYIEHSRSTGKRKRTSNRNR